MRLILILGLFAYLLSFPSAKTRVLCFAGEGDIKVFFSNECKRHSESSISNEACRDVLVVLQGAKFDEKILPAKPSVEITLPSPETVKHTGEDLSIHISRKIVHLLSVHLLL